ncbi:MAG: Crp/Fnr family transcriptional regulator [Acidobacteriota bacterium]
MDPRNATKERAGLPAAFDAQAFLNSAGLGRNTVGYGRGESIFTQGDPCESVLYIMAGSVKLSVLSKAGKEAVVAMLRPGDFFGEGCLVGQPRRTGSASALAPSKILSVAKETMIQLLHQQREMSDRFISHLLARNILSEEDLVDQLFNSSEKRLARLLLRLASYEQGGNRLQVLPKISQATLADMVGTTRSRVNFFVNKFKKLGFIEGNGKLRVHSSLLTVILHE